MGVIRSLEEDLYHLRRYLKNHRERLKAEKHSIWKGGDPGGFTSQSMEYNVIVIKEYEREEKDYIKVLNFAKNECK